MKKLAILGAGESGTGAALLAKAKGYDVFVSDAGRIAERYQLELQAAGIPFEEGQHSEDWILAASEVIKSPGIPQDTPMMLKVREAGIRVSSEIDFASRYTNARMVAITGTNGKTTTTSLIYHLLHSAGLDVAVAGNIGESFARKVLVADHDWFVLEVSSFQLEDIHGFHPNVAVLLNITPDHLDRYAGSMDYYAAAKFRMIEQMGSGDTFIYNADDEVIAKWMNQLPMGAIWLEAFSASFFSEGKLLIPPVYYPAELAGEGEEKEGEVYAALPLRGRHNAMNLSAAILAARRVGLVQAQIEAGLATFVNAPHRLENVGEIGGVLFVNDSKATNVDAAAYALDAFGDQPIIWIVGGKDKGNDYSALLDLVKAKVKGIICLGVDNSKLEKAFGEVSSFFYETQDVREAVEKAYLLGEKGDVALLSPACASFDLFKNYEDRGDQFRAAVKEAREKYQRK